MSIGYVVSMEGREMTKQQAISLMILENVTNGMSLEEAFDAVLGAGAFEKLAGEIYEELRK